MDDTRKEKDQDPTKGLENIDVTELEDKDLEGAAGGSLREELGDSGGNYNCNC
jgi:hypothetical protein